MHRFLSAVAAAALLTAPALAAAPPASPTASVADLVAQVKIPWQQFTLPNGLRVIVHTDRKAPVVAVSVWYHVGSKDEPAGQTGFAHLFEHLMFNGSENAPGDFFEPLQQIGATDLNGTTWFDRTNYFETVPTPALPLALFLESDRMGHLLGAVTQKVLDNQRGVVQNEKRQGDNQPYGLVDYAALEALFPPGHPYRHDTIGSMADLDAASLETVKGWFRAKYGPNNAVLVLAGDIDVATAKSLVTRYFGDIPRGPAVVPAAAAVPTLAQRIDATMTDRVATTRLYRKWVVPGSVDKDAVPLDVGVAVLGGLASSRLDNALVRDEKLAVGVSAGIQSFERVGMLDVVVDVRPGVDPATVSRRLDQIVADFIRTGPTADEVKRVVTRQVSAELAGLESVGGNDGKAVALAEGALYADDPDFYARELAAYAAATPAEVGAAVRKWMGRPVYALTVSPGERKAYDEAKSVVTTADQPKGPAATPPAPAAGPQNPARPARTAPVVGTIADLAFPKVERTRLSNGIELVYARREAVPLTRVSLSFDAGNAADPRTRLGTQSLMLSLLDEGTTSLNSIQIAEAQERLGANIGARATMDRTIIGLSALSANLDPSLALFADIVRNPAFVPAEVERIRATQLASIQAELSSPNGAASRLVNPTAYGPAHPYGVPSSGSGDPAAVKAVTRADLVAFHDAWIRPDNAKIFVVSDRPLAEVKAAVDRAFTGWKAPTTAKGVKRFDAPIPAPRPRILLVDRPASPQSLIAAVSVLPGDPAMDYEALLSANDVLGGSFLSRLNMDLREDKGWAYGANTQVARLANGRSFIVSAPVQADRTGDAIAAARADIAAFLTNKGVTPAELARTVNGSIRELPGSFETGDAVLAAMRANDMYGRPDDYQATLPALYRSQTAAALDKAARAVIDPARLTWIVVGDAAKVRPQLAKLGLPVEDVVAK